MENKNNTMLAKPMDAKWKAIVNEAYVACMHDKGTDEQKLIWMLANAIHNVRMEWITDNVDAAKKILYENDYTAGTN